MCGRFTLQTPSAQIATLFDGLEISPQEPRHNICPTQNVLTVRNNDRQQLEAVMLRWGLVPFWATDLKVGARMINARSETVFEKPSFRSAAKSKRCVIVADGFYEWTPVAGQKKKQPWLIARPDGSPWLMAGLWEQWKDKSSADAPVVETCTIITTGANAFISPIHDRMPVILQPEQVSLWLDPSFAGASRLKTMLKSRAWDDFEMTKAEL